VTGPVIRLRLFTTAACHLCEHALALVEQAGQGQAIDLELVDIVDDEQLLAQYGIRIPVLRRADDGAELGWPFDVVQLQRFLETRWEQAAVRQGNS